MNQGHPRLEEDVCGYRKIRDREENLAMGKMAIPLMAMAMNRVPRVSRKRFQGME